jgi:hypothetical protein
MEGLKPLTQFDTNQILDEKRMSKIKYLEGSPRAYRFNASTGVLNLNGLQNITQPKEHFSFTPVAYRFFEDELFGKEEKMWLEFFFVNESLQMCSVMFHGFSAASFKQHFADYLYYDSLTPCEVEITVMPEQKTNKALEAKYFIADFKSKKASPETIEAVRVMSEAIPMIFRDETLKNSGKHIVSQNYKLKENDTQKANRMLYEAEERKALEDEFNLIGNVSGVRRAA